MQQAENVIAPFAALQELARLRREARAEIDRLIAFLDDTDTDADFEPDNDDEISSDDEFTLGWPDGLMNQQLSLKSPQPLHDECEVEDEHGGNIDDEPHDEDPDEPSLGSSNNTMNQDRAWGHETFNYTDMEKAPKLPPERMRKIVAKQREYLKRGRYGGRRSGDLSNIGRRSKVTGRLTISPLAAMTAPIGSFAFNLRKLRKLILLFDQLRP